MPLDPIATTGLGAEARIPVIEETGTGAPAKAAPGGFGELLSQSMRSLEGMLTDAEQQSAALAAGKTQDVTEVVTAVERASLGLQLAVQVRNKAVEAYQDLFRMQI
jgi:flagellar hook-basal body complex protein FliE